MLRPAWGNATDGNEMMWQAGDAGALVGAGASTPRVRLEGEFGYGLALRRTLDVIPPFAGLTAAEGDGRGYRTGARCLLDPGTAVKLEARRS